MPFSEHHNPPDQLPVQSNCMSTVSPVERMGPQWDNNNNSKNNLIKKPVPKDPVTAPSSLCRLLMGEGPKLETITAEIASAKARGFATAPPPPDVAKFRPSTPCATPRSVAMMTPRNTENVSKCITPPPPISTPPAAITSVEPASDEDLWKLFDSPYMASFIVESNFDQYILFSINYESVMHVPS